MQNRVRGEKEMGQKKDVKEDGADETGGEVTKGGVYVGLSAPFLDPEYEGVPIP